MRLLVDMNLSPLVAHRLRAEGFEVFHWSEVGRADAPDAELMAWARSHVAVVITHDLDFGIALALSRSDGPSVVQIRSQDVSPDALCPLLNAALRQFEAELTLGALVTLDPKRLRARLLPVGR
mgnify:CR=1 FL=1|jgi:predicted nuclease of predicted toxin-antitoxin system